MPTRIWTTLAMALTAGSTLLAQPGGGSSGWVQTGEGVREKNLALVHIQAPAERLRRFAKLGTIDLRVDYLRPAIGERFELRATVMRLGSRVASTRMEFLAGDGTLLSTAAGAYIVS